MQFFEIPQLLSREEVAKARAILGRADFADGGLTAATIGPAVKQNLQVKPDPEILKPVLEVVQSALMSHEAFTGAVFPRKLHLNINRYENGMFYGDHNDAAIVGNVATAVRTDMSFTIFLADPGQYDGGEMVIRAPTGDVEVKLPAGDAIVYSGSTVHRVEPVTRGARLAVFGWAQSFIGDPTQRQILAQLRAARRAIIEDQPNAHYLAELGNAYNNLMRLWAEN